MRSARARLATLALGCVALAVPLDQVASVTYRPSNRRVIIGVVVAVTFVAVVILAHSDQSKPKPSTASCMSSSGPYYSRDVGALNEAVTRLR